MEVIWRTILKHYLDSILSMTTLIHRAGTKFLFLIHKLNGSNFQKYIHSPSVPGSYIMCGYQFSVHNFPITSIEPYFNFNYIFSSF